LIFRIAYIALVLFVSTPLEVQAGGDVPIEPVGESHRARYGFASATQKLTDNRGQGRKELYGTRNFRAVLNGVYYRGGANNVYHVPARGNSNPLTSVGLTNLCEEGFGRAVYLYSTNYQGAPKKVKCRDFSGADNTLEYLQISPLAYKEADLRKLLTLIHQHARDPRLGPIYDHCWNGWHASGFVAATTLRQFCGFSGDQAVAYWDTNTDGNNKGAGYDKIRARLRAFRPFAGLSLSAEERAALCPKPGSLRF
jgi:hypothetical protein